MLHTGIKIQLIWIFCVFFISAQAYYFNNGYMALRENREEPSTGNYNFEYSERHENQHSFKREKRVGNRVTGEYGFRLPDGRMRITRYIADENGYRTMVDSNEVTNNRQSDEWAIEQFESERLNKLRAHERQQIAEQKRLLNEQIKLQEQIQENEIRRQNSELENSIIRENNEQKVEVYVAPLPIEIERQNTQSIEKQREEHQRASKQWILEQQRHFEAQQIARQKAIEKKEQEDMIEKIRQQQLILQQKIWQDKQEKKQQRKVNNKKIRRKEQSIQKRILEEDTVEQQKENSYEQQERTNNIKEEQWWFKENQQQLNIQNSDHQNEKLVDQIKTERKIDAKVEDVNGEVRDQNLKTDTIKIENQTGENINNETNQEAKSYEQNKFQKEGSKANVETGSKKQRIKKIISPIKVTTSNNNQIDAEQKLVKAEINVESLNDTTTKSNTNDQSRYGNRNIKIRVVEGGRKGENSNIGNSNYNLERKPNWVTYGRVQKRKRVRGKTSEVNSKTSQLEREQVTTTTKSSLIENKIQENATDLPSTISPTTVLSSENNSGNLTTTNSPENITSTPNSSSDLPTTTVLTTIQPSTTETPK